MKANPLVGIRGMAHPAVRVGAAVLVLAAAAIAAPPAQAATVELCAEAFDQTIAGVSVPMWGYRLMTGVPGEPACGTPNSGARAPGPVISVPWNDPTLVVNLRNGLPVPTSLVIASQNLPGTIAGQPLPPDLQPVHATDVQDANGSTVCTPSAADTACRVRSFTGETAPGAVKSYTFANLRPGSFLYHSGTHPQVQVQMGLAGMLRQDAGAGQLYPGHAYGIDVPVVLSEVDPAMHVLIRDTLGTPGNQGAWRAGNHSTLGTAPSFFLINGKVFDAADPPASDLPVATFNGARVILRLANAGLQARSLLLNGGHWELLAEDGYRYPASRGQYSAWVPPGKTLDAQLIAQVPASGVDASLAIFDRRGGTLNANGATLGGQVARLAFSNAGPPPNQAPTVNAGPDQTLADTSAAALLAGSVTDDGVALPLTLSWSMVSGPGTVTFGAPNAASTSAAFSALGRYTLRLSASDTEFTAFDDVVISVNSPPTANAGIDQTVTVASATLSGTASDDGALAPLTTTWSVVSAPAGGTVTLAAPGAPTTGVTFGGALGAYTMRLTASDGQFSVADDVVVSLNAAKHVADLDRTSSTLLPGLTWTATVTIKVENALHGPVSGATVAGTWSGGGLSLPTCVTNTAGICSISRTAIPWAQTTNTFTVSNVTGAAVQGAYVSANNHDPDTGVQASNGTTIVVPRP